MYIQNKYTHLYTDTYIYAKGNYGLKQKTCSYNENSDDDNNNNDKVIIIMLIMIMTI